MLAATLPVFALLACTQPATTPTFAPPAATRAVSQPPAPPATSTPEGSPGGAPTTAAPLATSSAGATTTPVGGTGQWQALTEFPGSGAFQVTSVTGVGDGFVAVGFGAMPGEGYFGRHQGLVWRSADGRAWAAEADPAFQFVTPEEVVALGDSTFIFGTIAMCDALLADECVEPPESGWAVWRSTAGGPWERLPQLPQMQFGSVDGVAVFGTSLIVFGSAGDEGRAIVWSSVDGANWTATTDLGGITQVTAAASSPVVVVLFGSLFADEIENVELVAVRSTDGARYEPATAPRMAGATVRSIAAGANGLVAVGEREGNDLQLTTVALQSADGATWTEAAAPDGSFADSGASFVHSVPNGYAAVGFVPIEDAFGSSTGTSWLSADGTQWQALARFSGAFTGLDASASAGPGIVAFTVTSEEPDEQTVTSTIGAWFLPH